MSKQSAAHEWHKQTALSPWQQSWVREEGCLPGGHLAAKLGEGKKGKPDEGGVVQQKLA